jgi:hypothetical protein
MSGFPQEMINLATVRAARECLAIELDLTSQFVGSVLTLAIVQNSVEFPERVEAFFSNLAAAGVAVPEESDEEDRLYLGSFLEQHLRAGR